MTARHGSATTLAKPISLALALVGGGRAAQAHPESDARELRVGDSGSVSPID